MSGKAGYLSELDGVRAVSILLVLAAHMLPLGLPGMNHAAGLMGMSLFFCLSGFLITRFLYERPDLRTFFTRRIARIYPLLLVYATIVALVIHRDPAHFQAAVLFYINYPELTEGPIPKGMGHLWSLCVEFHFYAGIGLAVLAFGRRAFWLVPIVALTVTALRIQAGAHSNINTHLRVDEILSGSMLALVWLNPDHPMARRVIVVLKRGFLPLLLLWLLSSQNVGGPLNYLRPYLTMGVVGSILFIEEGQLRRVLRLGILAYIAKISYALYVWHPLTYMGWLGEVGPGGKIEFYLTKRPISFALTFALAHLSTHTLERYFMRLAKPGSRRRTEASP